MMAYYAHGFLALSVRSRFFYYSELGADNRPIRPFFLFRVPFARRFEINPFKSG